MNENAVLRGWKLFYVVSVKIIGNRSVLLENKIVISYMNAFSHGKSGGDAIFVEVFKRLKVYRHYVVTSQLGIELCHQMGFKTPSFVITTHEKSVPNIIWLYVKRILLGIIKSWRLPRPDILYISSDILPDILPALAVKFKYSFTQQKPIWIQKNYHINQKERIVSYYAQKLSIWLISRVSKINITCSFKSRSDFVKAGIPRSRLRVVFPGVDLDYLKKIPPSRKRFEGVFLGRLAKSKGIDDVVPIWKKVVSSVPDARLGLIGDGSPEIVEKLRSEIKDAGLSEYIEILGFLDDQEAFGILKSAQIFFFPSHEEGFGIVIAEAMACGCVAVAYNLPVYEGIFEDCIEKVPCFDTGAFAEAVISLLQDEDRLLKQGARGKRLASRFSWQRAAEEEMGLIQNVIATARRTAY
ncbi:MAG: glycosyltransferase family 4 protein [Desulfobacterales bacterium]|nr:glycosyltransferase family 4 protein [Desulfobacterales bacterium]